MNEDLGIIIGTSLEADESASAQRIIEQLPTISAEVNRKSKIKIQVELDNSVLTKQTQATTSSIQNALKKHSVDVNVGLSPESISKLNSHLKQLGVSSEITKDMVAALGSMDVEIDKITGSWAKAAEQEEQYLQLSIRGTNQLGQSVSLLQTYNSETDEINTTVTSVTANLQQQRKVAETLTKQAEEDNRRRLDYIAAQETALAKLQSAYSGSSSSKPITDTAHLAQLDNAYQAIQDRLLALRETQGVVSADEKRNIQSEIAALEIKVAQYRNLEYVATSLRTKTVAQVNIEQGNKLDEFEQQLRSAGMLTDEFQSNIKELRTSLAVSFDSASITTFLNHFDKLRAESTFFKAQMKEVGSLYGELSRVETEIARIKIQINGLDPITNEKQLAGKNAELAVQEQIHSRIIGNIEAYGETAMYARQLVELNEQREISEAKVETSARKTADAIKSQVNALSNRVDNRKQSIGSIINNEKVQVSDDDDIIATRNKLRELDSTYSTLKSSLKKTVDFDGLKGVKAELDKVELQFKETYASAKILTKHLMSGNAFEEFSTRVKRAKSNLEAFGNANSALFKDNKLKRDFENLMKSDIGDPAKLRKWSAEVSTFKNQVNLAGKATLSFGDTIKNAVSKFTAWISATTIIMQLIRAIRLMIDNVIELDTVMVELRKVTNETDKEYNDFLVRSADNAQRLGSTMADLIKSTSDFARLGYALPDAEKLAEIATVYSVVGDGLSGIDEATSHIIVAMKAYNIAADDAMTIVDRFNEVGKICPGV